MRNPTRLDRALLSLEGLSIGDAFGERFLSPGAGPLLAKRELPPSPWRTTDDTEMALALCEVLAACGGVDRDALASAFAERFVRDPHRGYGRTAVRILRSIAEGTPWREAAGGAFDGAGSMGNGAAMRVAPLGAYFADELQLLAEAARASAEVTHAHPEGQAGAVAVAFAAAWAVRHGSGGRGRELLAFAIEHTPPGETRDGLRSAYELPFDLPVPGAVAALGNGSGVVAQDTVPFALWCAARHLDDYVEAMWSTASGRGDSDTTCAIVGGIVALSAGRESIPTEWIRAREPLEAPGGAAAPC